MASRKSGIEVKMEVPLFLIPDQNILQFPMWILYILSMRGDLLTTLTLLSPHLISPYDLNRWLHLQLLCHREVDLNPDADIQVIIGDLI